MPTLFEDYEQQYSVLTAEATSNIGRLKTSTGDRKKTAADIEKNIEDVQELLEQMELEARELNSDKKNWSKSKVDCYRAELKRLILDFESAKTSALGHNFDQLEDFNEVSLSSNQKQKLLDNTEKIERSGKKLKDTYRIALEAEEIGHAVLRDLDHQRETIHHSRARLKETNEELNQSSRILGKMILRSLKQRALLYIIGICFVTAIVLGIYLSFS